MPNHTHNELIIIGDFDKIQKCFSKICKKENEFDFNYLLPMPEKLKGTVSPSSGLSKKEKEIRIKEYGATDWYDWSCEKWGTKWNAYSIKTTIKNEGYGDNTTRLTIFYQTAWAPPTGVIKEIIDMFPDLYIVNNFTLEDDGHIATYTVGQ